MSNRGSAVLLLAVLAALAVGVWIAVSGEGGREPLQAAAPRPTPSSSPAPDDVMNRVGAPVPREGANRDEVATLPAAPPPPTDALPDAEDPPEDGIDILVRVRETKEPVPNALVAFADWSLLSEEEQYVLWWSDWGPLAGLEQLGRRFRADEQGIVRVPRPTESGLVACEHGGLFGQLDLDSDPSARRTLELAPDRSILARVLDANGKPVADAQVGLRVTTRWWSWDVEKARSGPDGLATLPHAQQFFQLEYDQDQSFAVGLVLHSEEPVEVALDPKALPSEPLELVLPPHGSVEVILDPPAGLPPGPIEGLCSVFLEEQRTEERQGRNYQNWSPRLAENGRVSFPTVGLGLRFIANASSQSHEVQGQEFAGPTALGERVTVHLSLGESKPILAGRALLEGGAPLRHSRLRGTVRFLGPENEWTTGFSVETDEEGRFSSSLDQGGNTNSGGTLELVYEDLARGKLVGRITLSGRVLPGTNAVGDVVLSPPPLLASGRVVDTAGKGIRGARVSFEPMNDEHREFLMVPGMMRSFAYWGGITSVTGADGSFEIRGEMEGDLFQLSASHADYRASPRIEVPRGVTQVLTLVAAGRIAGRLQADEGMPIGSVQVLALDAAGNPLGAEERREADGRFELEALEPGKYTISARLADEDAELARVDAVSVEAGKTTEDPRLDPFDLTGRLKCISLRVRDRDGRAPDQLTLTRRLPGQDRYLDPNWWGNDEEIVLVTAERALDLRIEAPGSRTVELFGVDSDVEVTLRTGIPIVLDLSGIQRELGARFSLYAELVHLPEGEGRMDASGQADGQGVLSCSVGEPGAWGVRAHVLLETPEGSTSAPLGDSLLSTIEVADSDAPQTFVITADVETLQATLSGFDE